MQKYKITATKNQKKYTLVLSAESQKDVQEKIHKEGYSILKIEEYNTDLIQKNKNLKRYVFIWDKQWEAKKWIIVWEDILKIYIKLKDELEYDVKALFPEWDKSYEDQKEREKLLSELSTWYNYHKLSKSNIEKKDKKQTLTKEQFLNSTWVSDDFYLKKQLQSTYELIDNVIWKFNILFKNRDSYNIDDKTYEKLNVVYTKIISLKSSTNLPKLREIGELSLKKIAEVELKWLQEKKSVELQNQLKETNKLLKKLWSKEQFKDPDTDLIFYIKNTINNYLEKLKVSSIKEVIKKEEKKVIDKETYEYLRLILQLEKYEKKLRETNILIFKKIFIFINPFNKSDEKTKILLKKKVLLQNLAILQAKKSWGISSYTTAKKWFTKLSESILNYLKFIEIFNISFIFIFSYLFLIAIFFWDNIRMNIAVIPYFLLFFILLIMTEIKKHLSLAIVYIVFFIFSYIFIQVNF